MLRHPDFTLYALNKKSIAERKSVHKGKKDVIKTVVLPVSYMIKRTAFKAAKAPHAPAFKKECLKFVK